MLELWKKASLGPDGGTGRGKSAIIELLNTEKSRDDSVTWE